MGDLAEEGTLPRVGLLARPQFLSGRAFQVASMAEMNRQLLERLDPVLLTHRWELAWNRNRVDALFSYEPGYSAPRLSTAFGKPLLIRCSDPHSKVQWLQDYVQQVGVSRVLTPYPESMAHHLPYLPAPVVDFPWSVPRAWIHSGPIRVRGTGIACQGASGHPLYALRDWCRGFDFVSDHAIGGSVNLVHREEAYFHWMAEHDAFVVATSDVSPWHLHAVAKYVEVAAAGCLLIGQDSPRVRSLGFDETNALLFHRENFESVCRRYLQDPEAYLEHRHRGRELVMRRHTTELRVQQLVELLRGLTSR